MATASESASSHRRALRWLVFLVAAVAPAAHASPLAWEGTLALEFLEPAIPDARFTGTGVASVETAIGGVALVTLALAGGISGAGSLFVTDPDVSGTLPMVRVNVALGSGTLRPFHPPATFGQPQLTMNALPLPGVVRLCQLSIGCGLGSELALTVGSGATGVGVGGLLTLGAVGGMRISVQAAPWTPATATVPLPTANGGSVFFPRTGFVHGAYSFTGSTAVAGGELQLVTPIAVTSQDGRVLSSFGVLTLRFIPEPTPLAMLTSGAIGLLVLSRTRRR